jgi:hypothetical protein
MKTQAAALPRFHKLHAAPVCCALGQSALRNFKFKITHNFAVVLYGCETWSLTLREERRLRVSENRVLRWIYGTKREEVTRGWRKLHTEELNDLYSSPNIVRVTKSRRMR